jgi:hypothetical protein
VGRPKSQRTAASREKNLTHIEKNQRNQTTSSRFDTQMNKRSHKERQVKANGADEEEHPRGHERKRGGMGPDLGNEPTTVKMTVIVLLSR